MRYPPMPDPRPRRRSPRRSQRWRVKGPVGPVTVRRIAPRQSGTTATAQSGFLSPPQKRGDKTDTLVSGLGGGGPNFGLEKFLMAAESRRVHTGGKAIRRGGRAKFRGGSNGCGVGLGWSGSECDSLRGYGARAERLRSLRLAWSGAQRLAGGGRVGLVREWVAMSPQPRRIFTAQI
jgi:hypothetical protein